MGCISNYSWWKKLLKSIFELWLAVICCFLAASERAVPVWRTYFSFWLGVFVGDSRLHWVSFVHLRRSRVWSPWRVWRFACWVVVRGVHISPLSTSWVQASTWILGTWSRRVRVSASAHLRHTFCSFCDACAMSHNKFDPNSRFIKHSFLCF